MTASPGIDRALVLGGGGVAGIAWEIGIVAGLAEAGVALGDADLFVGTSAGSVAGAQLAHGLSVAGLFMLQRHPPPDSAEQFRPYSQAEADAQNRKLMEKVGGDLVQARRRIGAFARRAETPAPEARRAIIVQRLGRENWPAQALRIVAADVDTGAARVFDAASACSLVDAVAASCAVPGTWPPVAIGGACYMDGGIVSMTNADVAAGARRIVVLSPFGYADGNPVSGHLRSEIAALREAGSTVEVIEPDAGSLAAMGENVLDPARRPASAEAGFRQGVQLAGVLGHWWRRIG